MGDRANIVIDMPEEYKEGAVNHSLYLYTHWGGSELPQTLQASLASDRARARWGDESYLARIIFADLTAGYEKEETGFGISLRPPDNSYPYLRVDGDKRTVTVDFDPVREYYDQPNKTYTFEEFIALPDIDWAALGLER